MPEAPSIFTPRYWEFLGDDDPPEYDLAEEFHEASKFQRVTMGRETNGRRLKSDPELRASAAIGARSLPHLPRVELPAIDVGRERTHHPSLFRNASCRDFVAEPLPVDQLGRALWLSYGAHPERHPADTWRPRPVASGGALYPLELYLLADVAGSGSKGLYHYNIHDHALEEVRPVVDDEIVGGLGSQPDLLASVPAIVLINGLFWRSRFKYKLRGYRLAMMEAGAVIQQLTLAAQAFGWGVVPFAGLWDAEVEELCEIDGVDESFLNAVLLGRPR